MHRLQRRYLLTLPLSKLSSTAMDAAAESTEEFENVFSKTSHVPLEGILSYPPAALNLPG